MNMNEFTLKLLRGQIPGLPSEQYQRHHVAVELAIAVGVDPSHVSQMLGAGVLRTNDEIAAFDLSEA